MGKGRRKRGGKHKSNKLHLQPRVSGQAVREKPALGRMWAEECDVHETAVGGSAAAGMAVHGVPADAAVQPEGGRGAGPESPAAQGLQRFFRFLETVLRHDRQCTAYFVPKGGAILRVYCYGLENHWGDHYSFAGEKWKKKP